MSHRSLPPFRITATLAALWLSACGGGGDPTLTAASMPGTPMAVALDPQAAAATTATAPAYSWSLAFATPRIWHSMSTNADGTVIAAGEAGGPIRVSHDGGSTWTAGNSANATWISSAMTAAGDRIFAVQYGGGLYLSRDYGNTWSPLAGASLAYEAVTVSRDGTYLAAVVQNGPLVLSSDGGSTWRTATMPDGQPSHWWRWVDSSSDGRVIVGVSHNGEIFRSADYGSTWLRIYPVINGSQVSESWYRVKTSADGQTIAVVANSFGGASGTGIYVTHDGGSTWVKGYSLVADYTFLAMSADGQLIAASVSNTGSTPGRIMFSSNGGASFSKLAMPGSDTNWRTVVMSSTGDRLAAATGAFNTQSTGLLYTARSSSGTPAPSPSPAPAPAPSPTPAPSPSPAPSPAPACSAPAWNQSIRYMPGDRVTRVGNAYTATQQSATAWNEDSPPEWTPNYWSLTASCSGSPAPAPAPAPTPAPAPAPSPSPAPAPAPSCSAPAWDSSVRYMPGDRVLRLGVLYVASPESANVYNEDSPPEWTPNYWDKGTC